MKTYKAAFVGTGMIGAGLAANAALNNFDVTYTMLLTGIK